MRDPIFKGATRPAMMVGVPTIPFIGVASGHFLVAMWLLVLVGCVPCLCVLFVGLVVVLAMRYQTSQDEQRLNQLILHLRWRSFRRNAAHWGAHSLSPTDYQKRK
jgi:type IV secretion system protein VirB3